MFRLAAVSTTALALLIAPAAASAASTHVVSAYAYFAKDPAGFERGTLWVAFRTNELLRKDKFGNPRAEGAMGVLYPISRRERCYGIYDSVAKGEPIPKRIRLRLGKGGSIVDTRLRVGRVRPGYGQGGAIGCTRDRTARIYTTNLTQMPQVEPKDLFFAANNGPRVIDIHWHGWGTNRAVGYGTYMARFAGSHGSEEELDVRPAKIVYTDPEMCDDYGALAYTGFKLITRDGNYKKHVEKSNGTC